MAPWPMPNRDIAMDGDATDVDVWPSPVTGLAAMLQCRDRRVGITWYRRRRVSPFERMNLLV